MNEILKLMSSDVGFQNSVRYVYMKLKEISAKELSPEVGMNISAENLAEVLKENFKIEQRMAIKTYQTGLRNLVKRVTGLDFWPMYVEEELIPIRRLTWTKVDYTQNKGAMIKCHMVYSCEDCVDEKRCEKKSDAWTKALFTWTSKARTFSKKHLSNMKGRLLLFLTIVNSWMD